MSSLRSGVKNRGRGQQMHQPSLTVVNMVNVVNYILNEGTK